MLWNIRIFHYFFKYLSKQGKLPVGIQPEIGARSPKTVLSLIGLRAVRPECRPYCTRIENDRIELSGKFNKESSYPALFKVIQDPYTEKFS